MCCKDCGCQEPEELQGAPEDCSPEQVKKCHGEDAGHPCVDTGECEQPEELDGEPGECSAEQVRKCHGDSAGHPCEG